MTHAASTQPHDAHRYEIRVQGRLDPRWSTYLDGVNLAPDADGTTVLPRVTRRPCSGPPASTRSR